MKDLFRRNQNPTNNTINNINILTHTGTLARPAGWIT